MQVFLEREEDKGFIWTLDAQACVIACLRSVYLYTAHPQ